jgi:hypothetical protein
MFIRDPGFEFFHPGSRVKKALDPGSGSATMINYFSPIKMKLMLAENIILDVYSGSRIRDVDFFPSRIQGSKKHRIPGRIRNTDIKPLIAGRITWVRWAGRS